MLMHRPILSLCTFVAVLSSSPLTAFAADESLIATAMQDQPRALPKDNTASFSRADRKIRFQLVKLAGTAGESLAGTNVKVIGPAGQEVDLVTDERGTATLSNVESGLHGMVVVGEQGHATIPIAFRATEAVGEDNAAPALTSPVVLPLIDIDPKELLCIAGSYLSPAISGSYEDIDREFVRSGTVSEAFQYRVRLGDGGSLDGQVYSVSRSVASSASVGGTNLLVYRGNQLAGRAIADVTGRFTIENLVPGIYGLVAVGPAGYAAFALEAYNASTVAYADGEETLVSVPNLTQEARVPVLLVPPAMVPAVVQQIRMAASGSNDLVEPPGLALPTLGAAIAGGLAGSSGGGPSGGGSGSGGLGGAGLLGLAIIPLLIENLDKDDDDLSNFSEPIPAIATNGGL